MNSASRHNDPRPQLLDAMTVANKDIGNLLLRYSELRRDVAYLRYLLEDLAQQVASPRAKQRSASKHEPRNLAGAGISHRSRSTARSNSLLAQNCEDTHRSHSRLERACLIALMETEGPVAIETIYDRIKRRGSFTFEGYKHPFRAIVLAMGAMVRRGEAILTSEQGRRRWRWEPERVPLETPSASSIA